MGIFLARIWARLVINEDFMHAEANLDAAVVVQKNTNRDQKRKACARH
jgi:hypothetical protein